MSSYLDMVSFYQETLAQLQAELDQANQMINDLASIKVPTEDERVNKAIKGAKAMKPIPYPKALRITCNLVDVPYDIAWEESKRRLSLVRAKKARIKKESKAVKEELLVLEDVCSECGKALCTFTMPTGKQVTIVHKCISGELV